MRYLIISDLHGSYKYTKMALEMLEKEKADKILLLGDVLYHGPRNDLPEEYAPKKCIEILNEKKDIILWVEGNCDAYVDTMVLKFPMVKEAAVEIEGKTFYLTHGHIHNPENPIPLPKGAVVLYGHTHISKAEYVDGVLYVNPGSVSIPKGNMIHSYGVTDGKTIEIKDFDGNVLISENLK